MPELASPIEFLLLFEFPTFYGCWAPGCFDHCFGTKHARPHVVHAGQGLNVGLHTPTILGGNSHLSWFYDRGVIKDPAHTGTSKGLSQAINKGPLRKFLPYYANVYVTIQCHGLNVGARTHYVTANGVRNGLKACLHQYAELV